MWLKMWRDRLLLLGLSAALSVGLSWPTVLRFPWRAVGAPSGDVPKHLWNLWWMRRELLDGVPGLRTLLVNFPTGMELYPIEPLHGLPALLPLHPIVLSNVLALVHLFLMGVFSGALGWALTGRRAGMLAAAALAQGSAFSAFTLQVGVGELRETWWLPLGLLLLVRLLEAEEQGPRLRRSAGLGAVLAGAILSCFYHGLYLSLSLLLASLLSLIFAPASRRALPALALAAAFAAALSVPAVAFFAGSYPTAVGAVGVDLPGAALSPDDLLAPVWTKPAVTDAYAGGHYLGWLTCCLAVVGVVAERRRALPWVGLVFLGIVLGMGNVLWWDGVVVRHDGNVFSLPMGTLNQLLSRVAQPLNFPGRALSITCLALSVLGAMATRWRLATWLLPLAVVEMVALDQVPWPRDLFRPPRMDGLEAGGGEGAVADLLLAARPDAEGRRLTLAAQVALDRPVQSVPIERMDKLAPDGNIWLSFLPLTSLARGTSGPVAPADYRGDCWLLRERGFDRVLLTNVGDNPDFYAQAALTAALGEPVARSQHGMVWAVPLVEGTDDEIAGWQAAQQHRFATATVVPGATTVAP